MDSDISSEVKTLLRVIRGARAREASSSVRPWVAGNLRLSDPSEFLPPLEVPPGAVLLDVYMNTIRVEQWRVTPGKSPAPSAAAFSLVVRALVHFLRCSAVHEAIQSRNDVDVVLGDTAYPPHSEGTSRQVWSLGLSGTSVEMVVNPFWKREVEDKDIRTAAEAQAVQQQAALASRADNASRDLHSFCGSAARSVSPANSALPTPPLAPVPLASMVGAAGAVGSWNSHVECVGKTLTTSAGSSCAPTSTPGHGPAVVMLRSLDDPLNLPPSAVSHPFLRSDSSTLDDDDDATSALDATQALLRDLMTSAAAMAVVQDGGPCDVRGLALPPLASPAPP